MTGREGFVFNQQTGQRDDTNFHAAILDGADESALRPATVKRAQSAHKLDDEEVQALYGGRNRAAGGRVDPSAVDLDPTPAQKEAGNYAKDHVSIQGLRIAIENPKGSIRRGVGKDGKAWESVLPAHYGYIKRSLGPDGDHVDVYLGPHIASPKVFVIDQVEAGSRKFDEHKVFIGFGSATQVLATYKKAFSDGKGLQRVGGLHELTISQLKQWLELPKLDKVQVREHNFDVEVADNPIQLVCGLMFRDSLPDDRGMLFDLGSERPASFTMRNVSFPLDMLFIASDGIIAEITKATKPQSERAIRSAEPVRAVLEINGGLADKLKIKVGDRVTGSLFAGEKLHRDIFDYRPATTKPRCGNCQYTSGSDNGCGLYRMISQRMTEDFELDPDIKWDYVCNAWKARRRP